MPRILILMILVLVAVPVVVLAAPAPPTAFVAAMKPAACTSLKWSRITEETWVAYCVVVDKDPELKKIDGRNYSVVVFHHTPGVTTFDKLELSSGSSQTRIRERDDDQRYAAEVKGKLVTITTNGYTGELHSLVWDVGVYPPHLKTYKNGGSMEWSHPNAAIAHTCTVDLERHRDSCEFELPRCDDLKNEEERGDVFWGGDKVQFRTIPVLFWLTARVPVADPFACAAVFGDDASDTYFGKNPKRTTFLAIADHVSEKAPKKLLLYLRATDATPNPTKKAGEWQTADHFEIWLSPSGDANVDWRDKKAEYCAAREQFVQVVVAPHEDGTIEIANGTPKSKASVADVTAKSAANGGIVVEIGGTLETWAYDGALTVAYSDSLDGKKQDTLIGSSHVKWGKPETFGRLGRDLQCQAGKTKTPETLPWK